LGCPERVAVASFVALAALMVGALPASADDVVVCARAAEQAESLRSAARFLTARERLLQCVDQKCPLVVRRDCSRWLTEVDAQIPSLVFRAQRTDGSDMTNVRVYVDGRQVADQLSGRAIPLDPGSHRVRYVVPASEGGGSIEAKVLVAEGEQHRVLNLTVPAPSPGESPAPAAAAASTATGSRPVPGLTWALGSVAVGAGVASAALLIAGNSDYDSLLNGCGQTHRCTSGQVTGVRALYFSGDVALGAAVVALGGGLWSFLARPTGPAAAPAGQASVSFVPGGAVAGWAHSF
jgi:hypothetical protein